MHLAWNEIKYVEQLDTDRLDFFVDTYNGLVLHWNHLEKDPATARQTNVLQNESGKVVCESECVAPGYPKKLVIRIHPRVISILHLKGKSWSEWGKSKIVLGPFRKNLLDYENVDKGFIYVLKEAQTNKSFFGIYH